MFGWKKKYLKLERKHEALQEKYKEVATLNWTLFSENLGLKAERTLYKIEIEGLKRKDFEEKKGE